MAKAVAQPIRCLCMFSSYQGQSRTNTTEHIWKKKAKKKQKKAHRTIPKLPNSNQLYHSIFYLNRACRYIRGERSEYTHEINEIEKKEWYIF